MSMVDEDPAQAAVEGLAGSGGSVLPERVVEELVAALGLGTGSATAGDGKR